MLSEILVIFIDSSDGLWSFWDQAIIPNNAHLLTIGLLKTNFYESVIKIQIFSFHEINLKCCLQNVNFNHIIFKCIFLIYKKNYYT